MDKKLSSLLRELEQFGRENDTRRNEYSARMLNITPEVGEFLVLMIRALKAKSVLEVGTSNGYSTLWLAHAVEHLQGKVTTLEQSEYKVKLALDNFRRAGAEHLIDLRVGDAAGSLRSLPNDGFDIVFLDSDRKQYPVWWTDIQRILKVGGVIVADNALSHAEEIGPFLKILRDDGRYISSVVPLGNGEFVALKEV